jgi:hypothetical protein
MFKIGLLVLSIAGLIGGITTGNAIVTVLCTLGTCSGIVSVIEKYTDDTKDDSTGVHNGYRSIHRSQKRYLYQLLHVDL